MLAVLLRPAMKAIDILKTEMKAVAEPSLDLVYKKQQDIPGSVQYTVFRYATQIELEADEMGMMVYEYNANKHDLSFLELKYCSIGQRYCGKKNCDDCRESNRECNDATQHVDVFKFHFNKSFLHQFAQSTATANRKDEVLAFTYTSSFIKLFPVCSRKRNVLENLFTHNYTGSLENIYLNAKIQELLLYSMECLVDEKEETFSCKFLAIDEEKEKIIKAREVLLQHIGDPITIKELSRKVAMNECYLKKGFKEVFGTTIFEFYQQQRMEHAKYLLYEKGLNVTDVSASLGYSSISHFSTAFKKHTGLKPCELLNAQK